jgi:chaperonin cofactor prefoldin
MKKLIVAAALLLAFGTILHAEEKSPQPQKAEDAVKQQKDDCILNAKGCGDQAMSIQTKIDRLKQEIDKGTKVYTPQELQRLKHKLEDANDVLDELLFHPTNQ